MLFSELIRAALLDGSLYAQVKADAKATARALGVVGLVALVPWRLAAGYVAVRQALGLGRAKSALVLLVGVACGLVSVGAGTAMTLRVLA